MENSPLTKRHVQRPWTAADGIGNGAINYACGAKPIKGWVNVDIFDASFQSFLEQSSDQPDIGDVFNFDLLAPHPFEDNTFSYAYCEDFVEHLDQRECILFLVEVLRTLKPAGVLRVATPSLDGVLRRHFWKKDRNQAYSEADQAFTQWGHKHFFSHSTLKEMGYALGFAGYKKRGYGASRHQALRNLETRPLQIELNLYAELRKPG